MKPQLFDILYVAIYSVPRHWVFVHSSL